MIRPDFIGLGAQRSGTSWIYACLYDHPSVFVPVKEVHFFSRERNWSRGYEWYESTFAACPPGRKSGEFSTSYLADERTPERIAKRYPNARLIASLRHPADRAYSSYLNDIMAGSLPAEMPFRDAVKDRPQYLRHGEYGTQLARYLACFSREQILVLVYEDALRDPESFIRRIYTHVGVDPRNVPAMLRRRVNEGRVPRFGALDRLLRSGSAALRERGLPYVWWVGKRFGVADRIRSWNTADRKKWNGRVPADDRQRLIDAFEAEITAVEALLGRNLDEWRS